MYLAVREDMFHFGALVPGHRGLFIELGSAQVGMEIKAQVTELLNVLYRVVS